MGRSQHTASRARAGARSRSGSAISCGWRACVAGLLVSVVALTAGSATAEEGTACPPHDRDPSNRYQSLPIYLQQWPQEQDRKTFYTTSQGSRIMPYAWFKALPTADDASAPFVWDQLKRYGYLANSQSPEHLPVGFVIDGDSTTGFVGVTCAACHTAQFEYTEEASVADAKIRYVYRVDGAPAGADIQRFFRDLLAAARATWSSPARFDAFARSVLGPAFSDGKALQLKLDLGKWVVEFGTLMDATLPNPPWGPGRLDAFGLIFNRVGLDLKATANVRSADAPVRYPFLWNAWRQDRTQWNGSVPNGLHILGLARNTGEVLGAFADYIPTPLPIGIDHVTSADISGLQTLEEKIRQLAAPPWPCHFGPIKTGLLRRGKELFERACESCHGERRSGDIPGAWRTPIQDVGTDPRMYRNARLTGDPGLLKGSIVPTPSVPGATSPGQLPKADILGAAVIGILTRVPDPLLSDGMRRAALNDLVDVVQHLSPSQLAQSGAQASGGSAVEDVKEFLDAWAGLDDSSKQKKLREFFNKLGLYRSGPADQGAAYEARVLRGVWAAAPYLHNGSVPTLWQLLQPQCSESRRTDCRVRVFKLRNHAREYDTHNVGLLAREGGCVRSDGDDCFAFVADAAFGNDNGGHMDPEGTAPEQSKFGTALNEDDKWALIEYLKWLH